MPWSLTGMMGRTERGTEEFYFGFMAVYGTILLCKQKLSSSAKWTLLLSANKSTSTLTLLTFFFTGFLTVAGTVS
jgi:hypothetical protein